jgi:hypothetical protein
MRHHQGKDWISRIYSQTVVRYHAARHLLCIYGGIDAQYQDSCEAVPLDRSYFVRQRHCTALGTIRETTESGASGHECL